MTENHFTRESNGIEISQLQEKIEMLNLDTNVDRKIIYELTGKKYSQHEREFNEQRAGLRDAEDSFLA
jgi:hypothetical protein